MTSNTDTTTSTNSGPDNNSDSNSGSGAGSESEELSAAWEAYATIWKMDGTEAKLRACAEHLDPDCVYTDPLTQRQGWDDLVEYMVDFHQQVPGGHFVTTEFTAHHGRSMARWNMVTGDGTVVGEGVSYGEYADDNPGGGSSDNKIRVKTMTGFFETPA